MPCSRPHAPPSFPHPACNCRKEPSNGRRHDHHPGLVAAKMARSLLNTIVLCLPSVHHLGDDVDPDQLVANAKVSFYNRCRQALTPLARKQVEKKHVSDSTGNGGAIFSVSTGNGRK